MLGWAQSWYTPEGCYLLQKFPTKAYNPGFCYDLCLFWCYNGLWQWEDANLCPGLLGVLSGGICPAVASFTLLQSHLDQFPAPLLPARKALVRVLVRDLSRA